MAYQYISNRTSPNKWVGGNKAVRIIPHWWGNPKTNPTAEGVVNWLCNPASQVSAHYVVTGTGRRVWHLVDDKDRAWHAMSANSSSIAIEMDPRCRDEDYDVAAEVIADLWRHYGKLPLEPHKKFVNTACPGNYDLKRLQREAELKLNPPKPAPKPAAKPTTKPVPAATRLPRPLEFTAKLDKVSVWDLNTNPNYKAATTLKKGDKFIAYAQILFNGSTYYVTRYSFDKGLKNGVNAVDLNPVQPPAPKPEPKPTPEPAPQVPVAEKPNYEDIEKRLSAVETLLKAITDFLDGLFKSWRK